MMYVEQGAAAEHVAAADEAIARAIGWLEREQEPDGRWNGPLWSNCCMEAQWVLAFHLLGLMSDPKLPGILTAIWSWQREDGSWEVYTGAPTGDINATVECYAALRAAGVPADDPRLVRTRDWILAHGGLPAVRVFTRYWLALIGEWPWDATPSLPPELIWLPSWFPLNLYDFASWARATIVPLALVRSRRPVVPLARPLDELFPGGRDRMDHALPGRPGAVETFFTGADRVLSAYDRLGWQPGRDAARRACLEWIIRHQDADGGWGGIQPPHCYGLLALAVEGYPLHHPVIAAGLEALNQRWQVRVTTDAGEEAIHLQASESPVWDTLLSLLALLECGQTPDDLPGMRRALRWVLDREVRIPGDWAVKVRGVPPGGWAFESANDHYPDVDDTAVAILVLTRLRPLVEGTPDAARIDAAVARAVAWVEAMQCRGGGWGAFDRDNTSALVTRIPFCDFGEALDPPSVDVTAHVLEAFAALGRGPEDPVVRRALDYVASEQEADGTWFGRWGVNYIYGTAAVLPAYEALGVPMGAGEQRAVDWLLDKQNADGGWGESCASYMDDAYRGVGESTASQTGWALMALVAAEAPRAADAVRRGVAWLAETQTADGTWDEPQFTGTGFPGYGVGERVDLGARDFDQGVELARGFMINYSMYRHYFPLMALGRARRWLASLAGGGAV